MELFSCNYGISKRKTDEFIEIIFKEVEDQR